MRARTIDSDHAWLLPSRAAIPSTVTTSPTLTVVAVQPCRRRSTVLSSSIAQFAIRPLRSATLMNRCACGFAQSTAVIGPRSVSVFALSNFAEMTWCAASGASPSPARAQPDSHRHASRVT
ncbi:MAG: hypothetical protein DMF95_03395 [Acidobacteria bacterium]|nr:MAG: hypothetical protein DMF95_03395 [Acidobacteriota bacterium]